MVSNMGSFRYLIGVGRMMCIRAASHARTPPLIPGQRDKLTSHSKQKPLIMLVAHYVLFPWCKSETKIGRSWFKYLETCQSLSYAPVGYPPCSTPLYACRTYSGQSCGGQKYHLNHKLSLAPDRIFRTVTALHINLASEYRVREDGALSCPVYCTL